MAPAMRALGFTNSEIDAFLDYHPGENKKNIQEVGQHRFSCDLSFRKCLFKFLTN